MDATHIHVPYRSPGNDDLGHHPRFHYACPGLPGSRVGGYGSETPPECHTSVNHGHSISEASGVDCGVNLPGRVVELACQEAWLGLDLTGGLKYNSIRVTSLSR